MKNKQTVCICLDPRQLQWIQQNNISISRLLRACLYEKMKQFKEW